MTSPQPSRLRLGRLVLMLLMLLALYVIVPQIGSLEASWQILSQPDLLWTLAGGGLAGMTYAAGALTYKLLAFRPLRYRRLLLIQLAAMFVNRLLPAGVGGAGVNFLFLKRHRHTAAQAGSVVAVNNTLGVVGHWLLIGLVLIFYSDHIAITGVGQNPAATSILQLLGAGLAISLVLLLVLGRRRFKLGIIDVGRQLGSYRRRLGRLLGALISSMGLTLSNVGSLACSALALGVDLPLAVILLVFTFGISAATVTPTPGGLGGFEAGLAAGFIVYGVPGSTALAVALLYRFISYWLALAVGAVAFTVSQRRGYIAV